MGFFGLNPQNRPEIHEQIFQLLYYSQGGFTHDDVYNMPVYLRKFYYGKLLEYRKKEADEMKKAHNKSNSKMPRIPKVNPRFKR